MHNPSVYIAPLIFPSNNSENDLADINALRKMLSSCAASMRARELHEATIGHGYIIVARHTELARIIAMTTLYVPHSLSEPIGVVTNVVVHPGLREQGIGHAMVMATIRHARMRGITELRLTNGMKNKDSTLYTALGFTPREENEYALVL